MIGMAGYQLTHDFYPTPPEYMVTAIDDHWGYTRVAVNATHLTMQFVVDNTGEVREEFSLPNRHVHHHHGRR